MISERTYLAGREKSFNQKRKDDLRNKILEKIKM